LPQGVIVAEENFNPLMRLALRFRWSLFCGFFVF